MNVETFQTNQRNIFLQIFQSYYCTSASTKILCTLDARTIYAMKFSGLLDQRSQADMG